VQTCSNSSPLPSLVSLRRLLISCPLAGVVPPKRQGQYPPLPVYHFSPAQMRRVHFPSTHFFRHPVSRKVRREGRASETYFIVPGCPALYGCATGRLKQKNPDTDFFCGPSTHAVSLSFPPLLVFFYISLAQAGVIQQCPERYPRRVLFVFHFKHPFF